MDVPYLATPRIWSARSLLELQSLKMIHWNSVHLRCCGFADAYSTVTMGCTPRSLKWLRGLRSKYTYVSLFGVYCTHVWPVVPREPLKRWFDDNNYCMQLNDDVGFHNAAKVEAFFLAAARRARRMLREAEDRASIDEDATVETAEDFQPHRGGVTVHDSQRRLALCARKNNANSSMCNTRMNGKDVEAKRKGGPQGLGSGRKAGGEGKKKGGHDEEEQVHEDPIIAACKKANARAVLHLALWSQIACGNFDMDLRR